MSIFHSISDILKYDQQDFKKITDLCHTSKAVPTFSGTIHSAMSHANRVSTSHKNIRYRFKAGIWVYSGPSGWHFVSLPETMAQEIRSQLKWQEEGWGRLKAKAKIGQSEWESAIWFDSKRNTYLLPIKAEIRKKEKLSSGNTITIDIWI